MTNPATPPEAAPNFLNVKEAEIVHGPDVIAEKVSDALKDADRFGLHHVKPPLSEALGKVKGSDGPNETTGSEVGEHDALAGKAAEIEEAAGVLEPGAEAPRS